MSNWFAEIRPEGGTSLVECDLFTYHRLHPETQKPVPADQAVELAIGIGNEFLEKMQREHPGKKLHFDIYWNQKVLTGEGDDSQKAYVGATWAFNPDRKLDGRPFFWTLYSEFIDPEIPFIGRVKKELLDYLR